MRDLTISGMLEDTVAVLDHISESHPLGWQGCPSHILVGSSMGGLVAAWTAAKARHLVDAVVLLAPGVNLRERWRAYRIFPNKNIGTAAATALNRQDDSAELPSLCIPSNYCDDIELGPAMLADYANYNETELAAELSRLQVPVLLIHGECDDVIPIADAANFYLGIQHEEKDFWQVPCVDGGDHRLNKPMPDICKRITSFLDTQNL
jgi:pimeloyl-ACP methyl ester carboxylesterase